jgi:hypothetical protein
MNALTSQNKHVPQTLNWALLGIRSRIKGGVYLVAKKNGALKEGELLGDEFVLETGRDGQAKRV